MSVAASNFDPGTRSLSIAFTGRYQKFKITITTTERICGSARTRPSLVLACAASSPTATVTSLPRIGGLHHCYEWRETA